LPFARLRKFDRERFAQESPATSSAQVRTRNSVKSGLRRSTVRPAPRDRCPGHGGLAHPSLTPYPTPRSPPAASPRTVRRTWCCCSR